MMRHLKVGIIGNPNCGKSTLFNALTGAKQAVGNWPGVTVERKTGSFIYQDIKVDLVDLPGVYTLTSTGEESSVDVRIACESLLSDEFDLIINVIDASNIERNLYLTTQLLELGKPLLVVGNMQDVAERRGLSVDFAELSAQLSAPVLGISAINKNKINKLKQLIINENKSKTSTIPLPKALDKAIRKISMKIIELDKYTEVISNFYAVRLLEGSQDLKHLPEMRAILTEETARIFETCHEDADILIADARYTYAHQVTQAVVSKQEVFSKTKTATQWIDKIILNRFLGLPIFLFVMYAMFFFAIKVGGAFQPFFEITAETLFVDGLSELLAFWQTPDQINLILTAGVGIGIKTVITFVPVIFALFLFLSFLEGSGYMARASFVVDRCMRAIGLPGKSFVPLIVGFGCNVPAIMATRTLDQKRDRLLTLMMTPFMSCSARMAIYTVFVAAFFSSNGQNIVFLLYFMGVLMAVLTGLLLRKTVLSGPSSQWILELPTYHMPTPLALWQQTWHRLKQFIFRAGKFIVPVCILLGILNTFTLSGEVYAQDGKTQDSILAVIGKGMTPIFSPMGITQENWPATVGLLSGVLAKEVVVGTLNTLYTQMQDGASEVDEEFSILAGLKEALASVSEGVADLKDSFVSHPLAVDTAGVEEDMAPGAMGLMSTYFDGAIGAFAYLLFVLLYFPCVSAVAAMIRESSHRWATFSMIWTTGLAYGVAVIFYQLATFARNPFASTIWILGILLTFGLVLWLLNEYIKRGKYSSELSKNNLENKDVIVQS